MNASIEGIFVTVSVLLLTGMVTCRPRRRFCENFPFAPRCLGVAAKRDVSHRYNIDTDFEDTYKQLHSFMNQYGKDDSPEIWTDRKEEVTNNNDFVVPYHIISQLLHRRQQNDLSAAEEQQPDIWNEYE